MVGKEYREEVEQLALDGEFRQRLVKAMTEETPRRGGVRRPFRAMLAAAAVAVLTVTVALALSPAFREIIQDSLGFRAPYATEVLASCEDLGITIEAQKALTDGRVTRLYFTVHDPSGVFFLEDTYNNLRLDFLVDGEELWGGGGTGPQLLSHDSETQTGLYVYSQGMGLTYGEDDAPISSGTQPTQARLTMNRLIPGRRDVSETFFGPHDEDDYNLPHDLLESTEEGGVTVLLPGQNPQEFGSSYPEISISSMGFAADGLYHIRLTQEPCVIQAYTNDPAVCPFCVHYWMFDRNDMSVGPKDFWPDTIYTQVEGGWDCCLTALPKEDLELLAILSVDATYSISGGIVEGTWAMTVPVSPVDSRIVAPDGLTLAYTVDGVVYKDNDVQVTAISASPLSIFIDCDTPEGQWGPGHLSGKEVTCTASFLDGSTVEPTYCTELWANRRGWVMWEFDEEIDPGEVVSVTLNGNVIPFDS